MAVMLQMALLLSLPNSDKRLPDTDYQTIRKTRVQSVAKKKIQIDRNALSFSNIAKFSEAKLECGCLKTKTDKYINFLKQIKDTFSAN